MIILKKYLLNVSLKGTMEMKSKGKNKIQLLKNIQNTYSEDQKKTLVYCCSSEVYNRALRFLQFPHGKI